MAMLNPMLIDQKWTLAQIGVLMSVIGAGVGLLAAVSAAFLLKKIQATQLLIWAGWCRTALVWGDWCSHYFGLVKPVASALGGICHCHACDSLCRDDFVICLFHAKQFQRTGRHRLHHFGVL